jgi:hypothetical protein
MAEGSRLEHVSLGMGTDDGKRKVFFDFTGEKDDLEKLADDYISGDARVNLKSLKSAMKHLRDILHEKMVVSEYKQ